MREFCGEDPASSTAFSEEELTFAPGRHKINFTYEKILSTPAGDDMFTLSELALTLSDYSAIEETLTNANTAKIEIFSLSGKQLNKLMKGVNIVKETMTDGTQKTHKVIVK